MKIKKKLLFFAMFLMIFSGITYAEITVEKHWTPYNPPMSYPDGTKVYIIRKGDTLWDLAQKFLNNPYLWPKIWEKNKYISDPHWIYPGDPLVIEQVETVETAKESTAPEQKVEEFENKQPVEQPQVVQEVSTPMEESQVVESAGISDIKNAPYSITVSNLDNYQQEVFFGKIVEGDEDGQITFSVPDIVYAEDFGKLKAGETYTVVRPVKTVKIAKDKYVVILQRLGEVNILCINEKIATGKITYASDIIERGDFLVKMDYEPIPLLVDYKPESDPCQDVDLTKALSVIYPKDNNPHLFQGLTVVIEGGKEKGLEAGDIVKFFRKLKHIDKLTYMGEGVVLFSNENTSTIKVIYSEKEMPVPESFAIKR